jgi:glycosyltransferase involved in cell wall biosynthesis
MARSILFISDDPFGRGGTEYGLLQTALGLTRERWSPKVIVPARGTLYQMCIEAGIETRVLNFYRLPRLWRVRKHLPVDTWITIILNGWRLKRYLQREKIALIQSSAKESFNVRNLARIARAAGVPLLWSCHDSNPKVLTYCRRGLGIERVVAVSNYVKQELLQAGMDRSEKVEVLHNAIDLERWDRESASLSGSLRDELGVPPGRPLVGQVARLDPVKGQRQFLEAADLVAQADSEALFLLVGVIRPLPRWAPFADYLKEIDKLAERPALRGRVLFTGWRTDLPRVIASLDILVQPSLRETFGRVLTEAMAGRKPVIATRVGGMPEIVVNTETGLLVPPQDPKALAQAILRLLRNPTIGRAMGEAGRLRVEDRFGLPRRMRRLEAIYDQILRQRQEEGNARNGSMR